MHSIDTVAVDLVYQSSIFQNSESKIPLTQTSCFTGCSPAFLNPLMPKSFEFSFARARLKAFHSDITEIWAKGCGRSGAIFRTVSCQHGRAVSRARAPARPSLVVGGAEACYVPRSDEALINLPLHLSSIAPAGAMEEIGHVNIDRRATLKSFDTARSFRL